MELAGETKQEHTVRRHFDVVHRRQSAEILVLPQIASLHVAVEAQLAEVNVRSQRLLVTIEDADGETTTSKWPRPHFDRTFCVDTIALLAPRVLVHCDDLFVGQ